MSILPNYPPAAIISALETNLSLLWRSYSQLPGAEMYDQTDLFWVSTPIPFPPFNGVVRSHLQPETVVSTVTTILHHFALRRVPMLWLVGPNTQPADLGAHLLANGLLYLHDDPGMALELHALPSNLPVPPGFTVEPVNDLNSLRVWCGFTDQKIIAEALLAWGQILGLAPDRPIIHFLGRLNGRPVATSTLVLDGHAAGIYNVMTVPEAQHQGIGALMTVYPLSLARTRGYQLGVLQSSKMGTQLYRRLGFQEYCRFGIYLWPGEVALIDATRPN